MTPNFCADIFG